MTSIDNCEKNKNKHTYPMSKMLKLFVKLLNTQI